MFVIKYYFHFDQLFSFILIVFLILFNVIVRDIVILQSNEDYIVMLFYQYALVKVVGIIRWNWNEVFRVFNEVIININLAFLYEDLSVA